jgi:hypothetical protein
MMQTSHGAAYSIVHHAANIEAFEEAHRTASDTDTGGARSPAL